MNPRRSATMSAAVYPAVVIAGWAFVSLTSIGSARIENSAAAHVVDRLAPSLAANADVATLPVTAAVTPHTIAAAPQRRRGEAAELKPAGIAASRIHGEARQPKQQRSRRSRNRPRRPRRQQLHAAPLRPIRSKWQRPPNWWQCPPPIRRQSPKPQQPRRSRNPSSWPRWAIPRKSFRPKPRTRRRHPPARPMHRPRSLRRRPAASSRDCRRVPGGRALHRPVSVCAL